MRKCFVVSPIGDEGTDIRVNADKLYRHIIKPVCDECGFDAVRVDQINDSSSISKDIVEHLENDDLVIADITNHNPNVFYEIGYRTRTNKPIIYLRKKGVGIPFDITTMRIFDYDLTDLDSVQQIKERLINTINSFSFEDSEGSSEKKDNDSDLSSIMSILYQIQDSIVEVHKEIKDINGETISTVIKTMQNNQPQVSPDTALQMQLMSGLIQNPEGMIKILELMDKYPNFVK